MIKTVEFVIGFDETCRLRERFSKGRGAILGFIVQLETVIKGKSMPIRRYDTSHSFFHCDIIHADGRINKQPIPAANFNETLTIAEHDLRQFWKIYQDEFLREVENYGNK